MQAPYTVRGVYEKMSRKFGWHSGKVSCGAMEVKGKQIVKRRSVSSATSVTDTDYIIGVDTSSAAVTVTIPSGQVSAGRVIIINDEGGSAGTNNITVATGGSETVDGSATGTISSNNGTLALYSDGSNWYSY